MTRRVWSWTAAATVVLVVGWVATTAGGLSPKLRSEHAVPAVTAPDLAVVVTDQGKLFHRADCTFIHGPARSETAGQAMSEGYTACTRCLKQETRRLYSARLR